MSGAETIGSSEAGSSVEEHGFLTVEGGRDDLEDGIFDVGTGSGDEGSGGGSGGAVVVEEGSGAVVVEGGVEGSPTVLEEATYSMASLDGSSVVGVRMQRLSSGSVNMVCSFSTEDETLFSDGTYPEVWLIQGNALCENLSGDVAARLIANVVSPGEAEALVPDLNWGDLAGNCLTILRYQGGQSLVSEEFGESALEGPDFTVDGRRIRKTPGVLRTGFARSFVTINLSSYTLISTGYASKSSYNFALSRYVRIGQFLVVFF